MVHRLAKFICILAALQVCGGHWLALQSVAWIGMIANYSRGETLTTAIEKTFDGEHPCGLCKIVKSGREQEQKKEVARVVLKIEGVLTSSLGVPSPKMEDWQYPPHILLVAERSLAPPTPPPQAA